MSKKFLIPAVLALAVSTVGSAAVTSVSAEKKTSASGGQRSDFALFDGTNADDPDAGAQCGARGAAFTYYIAVSNFSNDTAILRVTYADGDLVRFNIPALSSFSLTQAAGGTADVDDVISVTSETPGALAGSVSALFPPSAKVPRGQNSYCVTLQP